MFAKSGAVFSATLMLLRVIRPIVILLARICLVVLMLSWVLELTYAVQHFLAGGWPALLGYVHEITQGYRPSPVSWGMVVFWHLILLTVTWLLGLFLWKSRRHHGLEQELQHNALKK